MAPARILVLTTTYPSHQDDWSGAFIHNLILAIRKKGFDVRVLAPSNGEFYGHQILDGVQVVRFGYFWPRTLERLTIGAGGIPENISKSPLAKFQIVPMMLIFLLRALFASRHADIIYANWTGAGLVGAIVSRLSGKPMIVSFRGDDGYLARDRLLWRFVTQWIIRQSLAVTAVSSELLEIMRDLGAESTKLSLPRFGVDTRLFYPGRKNRKTEGSLQIIFVGSLIPKKGLQDLIEALAEPVFLKVSLTIVGDGYYADDLKKLARDRLSDIQVTWIGIAPPRVVAELMRESDILVLPSYTEGSPNVIKEAMACSLPVIGTRVGGVPDLVINGETGFLYEPGDVSALQECLLKLMISEETRSEMGRLARNKLDQAGLNWDATASDFEAIFLRALDEAHEKTHLHG